MFAFQDPKRNIATSIKEKEALVYKLVFQEPTYSIDPELCIKARMAHIDIIKEKISHILISQSTRKVQDPDKINF